MKEFEGHGGSVRAIAFSTERQAAGVGVGVSEVRL